MNKNIRKALIVGMVILFSLFALGFILKERERNSHINKSIYPTFRAIEVYCSEYVLQDRISQDELKKCKSILDKEASCSEPNYECSAEEYYNYLKDAGFELPPFYEPGYTP